MAWGVTLTISLFGANDEINIQMKGTMVIRATANNNAVRMMPPILRFFMPGPPNLPKS